MNLKAVAQTFFNSLAGKTVFEAVILPEDIGKPIVFDGQRAVRVRPLDIYTTSSFQSLVTLKILRQEKDF